jgi:AcrR family transcriptional regulator
MAEPLTKGERTRQAIIDAASSLFIEQGYHATSMRQIAERADIALGGIYNHFTSKEEIFDAVLLEKHPYRQVLAILQSAPGETMEDFARNAANTVVAELGKRPEFLKLVFIEMSEFKGQHAQHLYNTIFPQVLPLLRRFQGKQSELRELPPHTILFSFLGIFFAYFLSEAVFHTEGAPDPQPNLLEPYLTIYLHGILKTGSMISPAITPPPAVTLTERP